MARIISRTKLAVIGGFLGVAGAALAAPPDDGASAGVRTWTLNQARMAATITPSNSADLALKPTRAIWIGDASACAIAVRMADDGSTAHTFNNAQGLLPIEVNRVLVTGTSCTDILALY